MSIADLIIGLLPIARIAGMGKGAKMTMNISDRIDCPDCWCNIPNAEKCPYCGCENLSVGAEAKPKRIQLKRIKGWRKPPNSVVVSRPTKWGNPFNWQDLRDILKRSNPKAVAVDEFKMWIDNRPPYVGLFKEQRQWILDHMHELAGKDLACWCKLCDKHKDGLPFGEHCPDCEPCHCEALGELANGIR